MECKELFIFENGQPLTTPPPQVSFGAFRLTVPGVTSLLAICSFVCHEEWPSVTSLGNFPIFPHCVEAQEILRTGSSKSEDRMMMRRRIVIRMMLKMMMMLRQVLGSG